MSHAKRIKEIEAAAAKIVGIIEDGLRKLTPAWGAYTRRQIQAILGMSGARPSRKASRPAKARARRGAARPARARRAKAPHRAS